MKILQRISIAIFLIWIIVIIFIPKNGKSRYDNQFERFVNTPIYGTISKIHDLGRGSSAISIVRRNGIDTFSFSCNCAYEITKFSIESGDSISKQSNSRALTVIQSRQGRQIKFDVD
jgi:hypothetical protein